MKNKLTDIFRSFVEDIANFRLNFLLVTFLFFSVFTLISFWPDINDQVGAEPLDKITSDTRCPVCGMFVAKYDVWITQIKMADNTVYNFDGVKDMMAFVFSPQSYGNGTKQDIREIWVKDYYSLKWTGAEKSFYVVGSDVHGPMGHELIPFSTKAAAESFLADHKGKRTYAFSEITVDLIESLRSGQMMKK